MRRLVALVGIVIALGAGRAGAVEISYISSSTPNYAPMQVFGEGFTAKTEFFGHNPQTKLTAAEMIARIGEQDLSVTATPPAGLRAMRVISVQPQVLTVQLSGDGHYGGTREPFVVWAKEAGAYSAPYVLNRPQLFFLEYPSVAPGARLRVFGRDLMAHPHAAEMVNTVWLREPKSGKTWPTVAGAYWDLQHHFAGQTNYEIAFQVPADLAEGDYEVWVHSGSGGWFGWAANPLTLTVRQPGPAPQIFRLKDYGVQGDGVTDDTAAFVKACADAAKAGGGRVLVPAGIFALSAPLLLPANTHLQGLGPDTTSLRVVEGLPFKQEMREQAWEGWAADFLPYVRKAKQVPMIYVSSGGTVSDLEMRTGPGAAYCLESYAPGAEFHDFTLTRCRMINPISTIYTRAPGFQPHVGIFASGIPWRRVRVTDNVLRAMGFGGTYARSSDCVYANNDFEPIGGPFGTVGFMSLCGWHNLWENNVIRNSNRGFTGGPWPQKDQGENIIARNTVMDGGPNQGAAESYLIEYGGGGHDTWCGRIAQAGPDWFEGSWGGAGATPELPAEAFAETPVNAPQAKWKPDYHAGLFAIIIKGKGYGQYVKVKGNSETRMTLEQPWRVAPDASSWVIVRRCYYNAIFMNNTSRDTLGSLELWGGCLEDVVYRHMTYNTAPLHAQTHSEPILMYNRFEECQLYNSSFGLWELGNYDRNLRLPTIVGNVFARNRIEDGSVLLVRRSYGKRGYLPLEDPAIVATGAAIAYNVFFGNILNPKGEEYALHIIDPSCLGNVFMGNTYPMDKVLDKGTGTIFLDNKEGRPWHFKDGYEYDVRAYQAGRTY